MNQDEVDLIYNYLHENYEYVDGELIRKIKPKNGTGKIGDKLGNFFYHSKNKSAPLLRGDAYIPRRITLPLSHLIYIFHYKTKPRNLTYIDGNISNLCIENLQFLSGSKASLKTHASYEGSGFTKIKNKMGGVRYRANISLNDKTITLGSYKTKEEAILIYKEAKKIIASGVSDRTDLKNLLNKNFSFCTAKPDHNTTTGLKGVSVKNGKFYARIRIKGIVVFYQKFDCARTAHEAYLKAKKELT